MEEFLRDLRFSQRKMLKAPGFTVAIVLCLALGIGANSATFSFAKSLLFPAGHVEDPERVVRLFIERASGLKYGSFSYPDFRDVRQRVSAFSSLAVETPTPVHISMEGRNRRFWGSVVTANYFETLGVDVAMGRSFQPEEGAAPGSSPVAVVSHGFWRNRLGGDPEAIGETITINGSPFTVVGVAPQGFNGPNAGFGVELWVPMMMYQTVVPGRSIENRGEYWLGYVIGRLEPGVSIQQARAELDTLMGQLADTYPDTNVGKSVTVLSEKNASLHPMMRGAFVGFLGLMFAVVGLVLLLACVNVAGLLTARAVGRRREIAIRLALGIGRRRLIRQLLTESTMLAVVAGILGLLLSLGLVQMLQSFSVPVDFPVSMNPKLDLGVLTFTFVVAVLTGILFGLAPALEATRTDLVSSLKAGTPATGTGQWRLRKVLTVGQVCLSMILLVGATLALQSFRNAGDIDIGFRSDNLAIASVDLELQGYEQEEGLQFIRGLDQRLEQLSGVSDVGYANVIPMSLKRQQAFVLPQGHELPKDASRPVIGYNLVGPDYFEAMGISLLRGRTFTRRDGAEGPPVAVVNEKFTEQYWPEERALGKQFTAFDDTFEVVGVVENSKYFSLGEDPIPYLYIPLERHYRGNVTFFVRTTGEPSTVLEPLRRQVAALDPDLPVYNLKTMHEQLRFALLPARLAALIIAAFAALALFLSAVGLFAMVSYWVRQKIHEIAIRRAIGASRAEVVKIVVWKGASLALVGLGLGLMVGFVLARLTRGLLYGVDVGSPVPYLLAGSVLLLVVLLAVLLPTRRALRIGLASALRNE